MAKKRKAAKKQTAKRTPEPRQKRLPEMDDPAIAELEALAEEYAPIRDKRQALTKKEAELKKDLLAAMKKHGKEHYHHAGIDITVVHEKEKVKVKLAKADSDADDPEEEPEEE